MLRKYDPRTKGGPWRVRAGRHYVLPEVELKGVVKRIDLEFMFGEENE